MEEKERRQESVTKSKKRGKKIRTIRVKMWEKTTGTKCHELIVHS
jgi:hypothetical protein